MEAKPLQTATAKSIKKQIETHIKQYSTAFVVYENWYVGITNDPSKRKAGHKSKNQTEPYFWVSFNARTRRISETLEKYFHSKGMLEYDLVGGATDDSKYIYVYKKKPTILD